MRPIVVALVVAVAVPRAAVAQVTDATTRLSLTLDEAVARGLASSNRIAEAAARADAARALADQRRAVALPQAAAQAGYTRTNHVEVFGLLTPTNQLRILYPDVPDNYRARLDLQWPIYTGGRLEALVSAAQRESAASAADADALEADVRLDVTRAFWALVVADESVRVIDESLTRTRAHLRDVRNQLAVGLIPPNEVLTVEAQESRQRMLSIQAGSIRFVAEADLARLVGAPPGTLLRAAATLEPPDTGATLDALVAAAREQRRERSALVERVSAAETRQRAAASGKRPTVAVGGGIDYARPNPRIFPRQETWRESWDASVNVSWPLFDGGRTRAETAEASASLRAVQARLREFDAVLAVEVQQRLAELESNRAAIAAADDALRAATEARRVVGNRFAAGVSTSTEVLDAQLGVLQAALDRTQAIAAARLTEARLNRAVGQ